MEFKRLKLRCEYSFYYLRLQYCNLSYEKCCLNSVRSIQRLASSSVALICNLVVSEINDLFKISLIYAE